MSEWPGEGSSIQVDFLCLLWGSARACWNRREGRREPVAGLRVGRAAPPDMCLDSELTFPFSTNSLESLLAMA